jgi:Lipase (class 2)
MARKILVVHGYSDGSVSFTKLGDYFAQQGFYSRDNIFYVDYASMDDEATFKDFADKLDDDYNRLFHGERIDVACHSTGALVVRTWLVLRRETQKGLGRPLDCPVEHLLMFAPANFGSDLAKLGQSFLGKIRSTFFNTNRREGEDFMESGKAVLEGLEPASPFQWTLSEYDLNRDNYFNPKCSSNLICFPFVFAAGINYGGSFEARILKNRAKAGTDGTVRICGTSLNSRKLMVCFEGGAPTTQWYPETKFGRIPFAVFDGLNHGSIIDPDEKAFTSDIGPGSLISKALSVQTVQDYEKMGTEFEKTSETNYANMTEESRGKYQQFFFKVRDDVDCPVEDFFLDFFVLDERGKRDDALTKVFDDNFESEFYTHSADTAHRVMLLNYNKLQGFFEQLVSSKAKLAFNLAAKTVLPDVKYIEANFVVFDGAQTAVNNISFFFPNTTTLVDIVLDRQQKDTLLNVKGADDVRHRSGK